jgi:hypothetical protein
MHLERVGATTALAHVPIPRDQRSFAAVASVASEAALLAWIDGGPGVEAANDQLGGSVSTPDGRAPLSFSGVVHELRRDGEVLATWSDRCDEPQPSLAPERVRDGALLTSQWGGE